MMNRLVIELLSIEKGKAYGFHEYAFNLLGYIYQYRKQLLYNEIVIICKDTSIDLFNKFSDKFTILGFKYRSYIKRYWLETIIPIRLNLGENDLLLSPGNTSGLIKKCPEILVVHDLLFKRKELIPSQLMRFQREVYFPISIKKADIIVAISNFTKDDIEHYYPKAKGKVLVIHNFMDFNKFESSEGQSCGFDYFLAISNNADYKNQETIFKAYRDYVKQGGKNNLIMVGKQDPNSSAGRCFFSLPDQVQDRIIWKCNITNEELGTLYKGATCYISASKFEGLGMPVVEAMSFGLPVLLSDIQPHREVSMGKGMYFEPTNYFELANKMLTMDFGKRTYDKEIRELFSEENTSAQYIGLINQMGEAARESNVM